MGNDTDIYLQEMEELLAMQENYFETLIKMGIMLENAGRRQKAFDVYKKGLEKAERAKTELSYTMLGLLD